MSTNTSTIERPAVDLSRVEKAKLDQLPALITEVGEQLTDKDEAAREAALNLVAAAAARHIAGRRRNDEAEAVVHVTEVMKNYSTGEGVKGQEMRYASERALLLELLAASQGVAVERRTRKYRYSGGRREKQVHMFGYPTDIDRAQRLWSPLNDLLTLVAFSIPLDSGLTPQAQTRLRREFVTQWVKDIAARIDDVVTQKVNTTTGAANRQSDRHTAAITAMNEWIAEDKTATPDEDVKVESRSTPTPVEESDDAQPAEHDDSVEESVELDELTQDNPEIVDDVQVETVDSE